MSNFQVKTTTELVLQQKGARKNEQNSLRNPNMSIKPFQGCDWVQFRFLFCFATQLMKIFLLPGYKSPTRCHPVHSTPNPLLPTRVINSSSPIINSTVLLAHNNSYISTSFPCNGLSTTTSKRAVSPSLATEKPPLERKPVRNPNSIASNSHQNKAEYKNNSKEKNKKKSPHVAPSIDGNNSSSISSSVLNKNHKLEKKEEKEPRMIDRNKESTSSNRDQSSADHSKGRSGNTTTTRSRSHDKKR